MLTEASLISLCGGLAGLALAYWGRAAVLDLLSRGTTRIVLDAPVDVRLLVFTVCVMVATTLLFGLWPALRASADGQQQHLRTSTMSKAAVRQTAMLIAAQSALTVVLVAAGALFGRSLTALQAVDAGFQKQRVLLASVRPAVGGADEAEARRIYRDLYARFTSLAGVRSVTLDARHATWRAVDDRGPRRGRRPPAGEPRPAAALQHRRAAVSGDDGRADCRRPRLPRGRRRARHAEGHYQCIARPAPLRARQRCRPIAREGGPAVRDRRRRSRRAVREPAGRARRHGVLHLFPDARVRRGTGLRAEDRRRSGRAHRRGSTAGARCVRAVANLQAVDAGRDVRRQHRDRTAAGDDRRIPGRPRAVAGVGRRVWNAGVRRRATDSRDGRTAGAGRRANRHHPAAADRCAGAGDRRHSHRPAVRPCGDRSRSGIAVRRDLRRSIDIRNRRAGAAGGGGNGGGDTSSPSVADRPDGGAERRD